MTVRLLITFNTIFGLLLLPTLLSNGHSFADILLLMLALATEVIAFIWDAKGGEEVDIAFLSSLALFPWLKYSVGTVMMLFPVMLLAFGGIVSRRGETLLLNRRKRIKLILYCGATVLLWVILARPLWSEVAGFCLVIFISVRSGLIVRKERMSDRHALLKQTSLAEHDPLTGLLNRSSLDVYLKQLSQQLGGFALALFDIDKFKSVNDTYGHQEGDRILKDLAETMKTLTRDGDALFRYGGEEFLAVFPVTGKEDAKKIAENIRDEFERHVHIYDDTGEKTFTVSGGISEYVEPEHYADTVQRADKALYMAKDGGRNRCCVL